MTNDSALITKHRTGFEFGYTPITTLDSSINMEFGILKLRTGETYQKKEEDLETAIIVMSGNGDLIIPRFHNNQPCSKKNPKKFRVKRDNVFSKPTTSFLLPKNTEYSITASDYMELSILKAKDKGSVPIVRYAHKLKDEQRGKNLLDNTCWRTVRPIFDYESAPKSNIVVGEVINFPGRWSSYPDHAHPQTELYHYRFNPKNGYGFAKLGQDNAFVTKNNDTLIIQGNQNHPQTSAPGYRMYYLWAIKHLENNPYKGFEFDKDHKWLLNSKSKIWSPK